MPADFLLSHRGWPGPPARTTGHRPPDSRALGPLRGPGKLPGRGHTSGAGCARARPVCGPCPSAAPPAPASAPCAALAARALLRSRRARHPSPTSLHPLHLWLPRGVLTEDGQENQHLKSRKKGPEPDSGSGGAPTVPVASGPARHARGSGDTSPREEHSRRDRLRPAARPPARRSCYHHAHGRRRSWQTGTGAVGGGALVWGLRGAGGGGTEGTPALPIARFSVGPGRRADFRGRFPREVRAQEPGVFLSSEPGVGAPWSQGRLSWELAVDVGRVGLLLPALAPPGAPAACPLWAAASDGWSPAGPAPPEHPSAALVSSTCARLGRPP